MADELSSTMKKQSAAKPPLAAKPTPQKGSDVNLIAKKKKQPNQGGMSGILMKSKSEPILGAEPEK